MPGITNKIAGCLSLLARISEHRDITAAAVKE